MKRILLSLAAALCMCASAAAQTVAPFKDGDRAVFLGNSITDGGHYHLTFGSYYSDPLPALICGCDVTPASAARPQATCTSAWTATFSANAPRC